MNYASESPHKDRNVGRVGMCGAAAAAVHAETSRFVFVFIYVPAAKLQLAKRKIE